MAEELVLTDPIVPPAPPTTTKFRVSALTLDLEMVLPSSELPPPPPAPQPVPDPGWINIKLKDEHGAYTYYEYKGTQAVNLIKTLNTANCSTKSMQKRVLEKLSADGLLPGTVTGTPDPVVP